MRYQKCGHLRLIHPDADFVTGNPGLCNLKNGTTDAKPVADTDFVVCQTVDGEILSELAEHEIAPSK
jgi:hypothetical protein